MSWCYAHFRKEPQVTALTVFVWAFKLQFDDCIFILKECSLMLLCRTQYCWWLSLLTTLVLCMGMMIFFVCYLISIEERAHHLTGSPSS